jgi:hypothetical protein
MEFDFVFAPLFTLVAGIITGTIFNFLPVKKLQNKTIIMASFAVASALALYVGSTLYSNNLTSIFYFQAFATVIDGTLISNILGGSAPFASAILLSVVFEISLVLSFAGEAAVNKYYGKQKNKYNPPPLQTSTIKQSPFLSDKGLKDDHQSILSLFKEGKIQQITPVINASLPDGYIFEGVLQEWDTRWTRHVLDTLVEKGYLKAELIDKAITCTACGSTNVRVRKICPECNSLWLRREETSPSMYVCPICTARTNSALFVAKCENCGTTAELDEEPEIELFKYTLN